MDLGAERLDDLYRDRFDSEAAGRNALWKVLCSDFFQKWVPKDATVLDVAAGHCEFVNNIEAGRKIAIDASPGVKRLADANVETHVCRSDEMSGIADGEVDVVFVSNFFEHIDRSAILATLVEIRRVLKPTGRLLVLQPNIRFCAKDYWMFFDHITPVDDRALDEAFGLTGFETVKCIPRFLPYTTKQRLPAAPWLVKVYLRLKPAWRLLGAQSFMVAAPVPPAA